MSLDRDASGRLSLIIKDLSELDGACLPVLHAVQEEFGFIPAEAIQMIADALNLSRAEVHGVKSFYKDFRDQPPGRHIVQICCAESCQAVGGRELLKSIEQKFGIALGETTTDGRVTLQPVFCLGNCALSPAAMIDGETLGQTSTEAIEARLDELAAGAA